MHFAPSSFLLLVVRGQEPLVASLLVVAMDIRGVLHGTSTGRFGAHLQVKAL